jgi:hypothetical protein
MVGTIVALSIAILIVFVGGLVLFVRQLVPDRPMLLQGMFRYEADLGWPHGVQEEDGERAWVPREPPSWDPDEDDLAWATLVGTSTMADRDGDRPLDPVAVVRIARDKSTMPRRRDR